MSGLPEILRDGKLSKDSKTRFHLFTRGSKRS
jgi:hypothetical protein